MEIIKNEEYPNDFFNYLYIILKLGNIYDLTGMSKLRKIPHYIYFVFMIFFCQIYYIPAEWVKFPEVSKDLNVLIEHCGMVIIRDVGLLKLLISFGYRKRITQIIANLTDKKYYYENYGDYKPGKEVIFNRKILNLQIFLYSLFGIFVPFSRISDSIAKLVYEGHLIDGGNLTCQHALPFYGWIPFDTESKVRCAFGVIIQSIAPVMSVFQIIGCDLTIVGICLYLRSSFINLAGAFRTARARCLDRLNFPEDYALFNDAENPDLQRELSMEVKRMSMHLQLLVNTVADVEEVFNLVFLGQMLSTLFILVTCLYMLTVVPIGSPVFFAQLHYLAALLIEFFPFCILGNEITTNSSMVGDGIYEMDWYSSIPSIKSTMLINLIRLQRPINLTIGKFSTLSLATFVQVIKGSYSYFTVLNTMN